MRRPMMLAAIAATAMIGAAKADPVGLTAYADGNGYIDVQKLTCAQLANTFQEDADHLTTWYSGWYNGLGKKHMMKVDRAMALEHEVVQYCKDNQEKKVIQAIDVIFKKYRQDSGIKMQ
jgi:HdeA/HdeB family